MKPALLIIIMDFLLSSLLLFIGNGRSAYPQRSYGIFDGNQIVTKSHHFESSYEEAEERFQKILADINKAEIDIMATHGDIQIQIKNAENEKHDAIAAAEKAISEALKAKENEQIALGDAKIARNEAEKAKKDEEFFRSAAKKMTEENEDLQKKLVREEEERKRIYTVAQDANQKIETLNKTVQEMRTDLQQSQQKIHDGQQAIYILINEKVDEIKDSYQKTQAQLSDINSYIRALDSLPEKFKKESQEMLENFIKYQIDVDKNQTLVLDRLANIEKTTENREEIAELTSQLGALRDDFREASRKVDETLADKIVKNSPQEVSNPFALIKNARIELTHRFEDDGMIWNTTTPFQTYPVIVTASGKQYGIASAVAIGLRWKYFKNKMKTFSSTVAKRGENPWSENYDFIATLSSPCDIAITKLPRKIEKPLRLFSNIHDAFNNSNPDTLSIYKHEKMSAFSKINSSEVITQHIEHSKQIRFIQQNFNQAVPNSMLSLQSSDYIITNNGYLLCIMENNEICKVILEEDLNDYNRIAHHNKDAFAEDVRSWQKMCIQR